jgi:transcriptional regulator with XRE-family HTH domain
MKRAASEARTAHKRNRGSVMLAQIGETQAQIAKRVKCTREEVAYFESGQRKPGPLNRARFWKEYKVPPTAWDEEPTGPTHVLLGPIDDSVGGRIDRLQRTIDRIQEHVLTDESMTTREQLGQLNAAIAATGQLAKLTGEASEISDARLIRLPVMRRMLERLLKALEPWPDAMRAAGEALKGGSSNDDVDAGRS